MILKTLYDYYHRCDDLAPTGMEYKEIAFLIVIDKEGNFIRLEDRRIDKKRSQSFLVVKGIRSGSAPKPYLFYDNVEYVLGYAKPNADSEDKDIRNKEKVLIRYQAFIAKCISVSNQFPDNTGFRAVSLFYKKHETEKVLESSLWELIVKKPTVNLSFLIEGCTHIISENKDLYSLISQVQNDEEKQKYSICLVTGSKSRPIESTTPTMIPGSQATARLVAFQVSSGYDSYGKSKGLNAPISEEAEASYTTALNKLLAKDSRNKFLIANRTFVFWASSKSEAAQKAELGLFNLLGYHDDVDDPNRRIEEVRKVFNAIYSGSIYADSDDKFYFLGLAPNSARIAVVYWNESELREFAKRILNHFNDMEIIDTRKEKRGYYGLHQMMSTIALKGKASEVQPNLPETVIKSILQGLPYPYALLLACIKRIRAEQQITITRAAIIKAYLNRIKDNNQKLEIMIDKNNTNQGYLCGRLFATLEYLQERSNNINTIRSRYMNAASATPSAVFSTLLNLSVHHAEKLEKGSQIYFETIKAEIMDKISAQGFPAHLSLQDQGRFMVGYYHQRQEFYTSKSSEKE